MREVLEIELNGLKLRGVYHRPNPTAGESPTAENQIGIYFYNGGILPRAAQGDLMPHLADRFAAMGYPTFRFDSPGMGDSEGEMPADVVSLITSILAGGHAAGANDLMLELMRRFNLKGFVLLGHCGGAVSAIYSTDAPNADHILGMILLDPNFAMIRTVQKPVVNQSWHVKLKTNIRAKVRAAYHKTRIAVYQTAPGEKLMRLEQMYGNLWQKNKISPQGLPPDANLKLIASWQRVTAKVKPMLVISAYNPAQKVQPFDYVDYLRGGRDFINYFKVPDITHSMLEANGEQIVTDHIARWLTAGFPAVAPQKDQLVSKTASA